MVINELESEQNSPPAGIPTCGNFAWSLESFNEKLRGSGERKTSVIIWEIIVFAMFSIIVYTL